MDHLPRKTALAIFRHHRLFPPILLAWPYIRASNSIGGWSVQFDSSYRLYPTLTGLMRFGEDENDPNLIGRKAQDVREE
jgi:hypothetical protein